MISEEYLNINNKLDDTSESEVKNYRGIITKFLVNKDNGWGMALFVNDNNYKSQLTIKGMIGEMKTRVVYDIKATPVSHPKYGKSLDVKNYAIAENFSKSSIIKYLSGPSFPGVGKKAAEAIADYYQEDVIAKIKSQPETLLKVPNLQPHLATIILDRLRIDPLEDLRQVFYQNNLPRVVLDYLIKHVTDDVAEIKTLLSNNFYEYAHRADLKPIEQIDQIALYFGEKINSPNRIAYWAEAIGMKILFSSGDTYFGLDILKQRLKKELNIYDEATIMEGLIYAKQNHLLYFEQGKVYPRQSWEDEEAISNGLIDIIQQNSSVREIDKLTFKNILKEVENELGDLLDIAHFKFDKSQHDTLKSFLKSPILLVSGGPGTGKSTLIYGFILLYRKLNPGIRIGLAAPTGRASARLKNIVEGLTPTTIHKLLEANEDGGFGRNEELPLELDLMILDEMSMVDNHLFSQFIRAKGQLQKLVLVGDINQLPPVDYGNIFGELAKNDAFAFAKLTTIHRQSKGNDIIELAHLIETKKTDQINWQDFNNVETFFNQPIESNLKTLQLDYEINRQKIKNSPNYYQLITPFYQGHLGIINLNEFIQASFNETLKERRNEQTLRSKTYLFAPSDKIMCLRNNSDLDLTNGETGIIKSLLFANQRFDHALVTFGQKDLELTAEQFKDIALGYACSVHKTQGSEYQRVILFLESGLHDFFLNRKLIYTAITRAKESLMIIGDEDLFYKACQREPRERLSTLSGKIKARLALETTPIS